MEIRLLDGEERYQAGRISAICFHSRKQPSDELKAECMASKDEDWGAFDNENRLMGHIINNHFTVNLRGHEVSCGGIGAVSTLPEYRESGVIREIFGELLPAARERGEIISALYPFSHAFYRKFGYETVRYKNEYAFSPALLRSFPCECNIHQWREGDELTPYLNLYKEFSTNFTLSIMRDEARIKDSHIHGTDLPGRHFCYLLSDGDEPVAYVVFDDIFDPAGAQMRVQEAVWKNRKGFRNMLGFLGKFGADYRRTTLPLPAGFELHHYVPTPYDLETNERNDYMLRVINTEKALSCLDVPAGESFVIRVSGDEQIHENNGTWQVSENGIKKMQDEDSFDLSVSIQSLAQLLCGTCDMDTAALRPDVEIKGNENVLRRVFTRQNLYVGDAF